MLRYKEQKCGTVFDVVLQCFIVSVADREPLIVPDFPPGFIKGFDDSKDCVSVFVGIADKYVWFFFVCQKRRGEFFNSRREQPVKGLVLVIKDKCEMSTPVPNMDVVNMASKSGFLLFFPSLSNSSSINGK